MVEAMATPGGATALPARPTTATELPEPSAMILARVGQDNTAWLALGAIAQVIRPKAQRLETLRLALCAAGYAVPWVTSEAGLHLVLRRAGWEIVAKANPPKAGDLAIYGTLEPIALSLVCKIHLQDPDRWRESGLPEWVAREKVEPSLLWWLRGPCATCGYRRG